MLRAASLMRWAITRRMPMTGISCTSADELGADAATVAGAAFADAFPGPARARSRSLGTIRPPVPVPARLAKLIPASWARRRVAGDARTGPAVPALAGAAAAGAADVAAAGAARAAGALGTFASPVAAVSKVASSAPTAIT